MRFTPQRLAMGLAVILTLIGLLFVFEASVIEALQTVGDPYHFVRQQLIWFGMGMVAMITIRFIPLPWWKKVSPLLYVVSVILLLLVFMPGLKMEINGAYRWIKFSGITLQPVEPLKLAMVMFFASWMTKHQRLAPFLFLTLLPIGLLLLQPDLGSALIVGSIAFGMYFLAGGNLKTVSVLGLLSVVGVIGLILIQPYRLRRLTTFLNPDLDPLGASFHIRQITIALGSGGWFGQGIGQSRQKFSYIPEASSDSIFAIVAEEVGFVGSLILLTMFILFLMNGYKILNQQPPQSFSYLLAGGILIWLSVQIMLNLSAVVALVPLTGVPLPFFSYGGSALVTLLTAVGILSAIRPDHNTARK